MVNTVMAYLAGIVVGDFITLYRSYNEKEKHHGT